LKSSEFDKRPLASWAGPYLCGTVRHVFPVTITGTIKKAGTPHNRKAGPSIMLFPYQDLVRVAMNRDSSGPFSTPYSWR